HTEADQAINRNLAQQYADARLLVTEEPLTALNFHKGISRLAQLNPEVDIYLLDDIGAIVASSVPDAQWVRTAVDLGPLEMFLADSAPLPILGDDPRQRTGRVIFSAAPVVIADCPARYLYVILHGDSSEPVVRKLRNAYAINESLALLISCGVLAVIATLILIRSITQRLSTLKSDMEAFQSTLLPAETGSALPQPDPRGDEIERLATLFGVLSARVRHQMDALRDTDEARRSMVANISHDLRTPLTTLQAHLDTLLLKDSDISPVERHQYLTTAAGQCRRLTKLVTQLLDLAKLDAGQVPVQAEPFQLAELVQDIAQELTLTAAQTDVTVRAEYSDSLPLVAGDIGLIERVVDKLAENAIQHTPPGGSVSLWITHGSTGLLRLEVEDNGPGIPPDSQARMFDRFYRADVSRSGTSHNAGLGLAIVKSVLDLHGTSITVDSKPGLGSRFSFELPVHR
ncbi:MAG: HAMP domain-containing sensor histidine kinase, partial [Gammaproteobacteria bacterium]|nr:HAMP domain-containing sensor histidine kinase [Gammaproteobacteria bacterium]